MFVCWLSRLFIHFFSFFFFFSLLEQWLDVYSLAVEGEENVLRMGAIQKILLIMIYSDSAPVADITLIQKHNGDFCPGPGCDGFPQNLIDFSGLWMDEECLVPSTPLFPNCRPLCRGLCRIRNFHEVMKGSRQQVLKRPFFFLNSTPNFCAKAFQTLLLLVQMIRETALFHGCLSEETSPVMPCPHAMRGSGWD